MADHEDSTETPDAEAPIEESELRFAVNLRSVRGQRVMSQVELAQEMTARGWPWRQQTVTRVESGRRMVRLGEALAIAAILEVPLDQLTSSSPESDAMEAVLRASSNMANSALYVSRYVHNLLIARENAEKMLAETEDAPWLKVRALREVLADRLDQHTLDAAVEEGSRRHLEREDPQEWVRPRRTGLRAAVLESAGDGS